MRLVSKSILAIFVIFTLVSCGNSTNSSQLNYVSWGLSSINQTLIPHAREDVLRLCLTGEMNTEDLERVKQWSLRSVLTWLRVLKVHDQLITKNIAYSCEQSHLTFKMKRGNGTSFASPGQTTIYLNRPYGTWTHELGHALAALGDTYAGGAGQCKSGQPQSLMCWGAYGPRKNPDEFSTLWPDDIEGITFNYFKLYKQEDLTPPEWATQVSLEAPLDANNPWPEEVKVEMIDHLVSVDDKLETVKIHAAKGVDL